MKVRTTLHAGYNNLNECQQDVNYWAWQTNAMSQFAQTGQWPPNVPFPVGSTPVTPSAAG